MIDVAEDVVPGKSVKVTKNAANDWFFKCHFPGDPNMQLTSNRSNSSTFCTSYFNIIR